MLAIGALVAGCGGESAQERSQAAKTALDISIARQTIALYVQDRAHERVDDSYVEAVGYDELLDAVDDLIALYRAQPDLEYDRLTMRQVLQDAASDLDDYEPDLAAELDRAIG